MTRFRILVVEDEAILALGLRLQLQRLGYVVTGVVNSGQGALEAVGTSPPDLILMDISLRGDIDGVETARLIQKDAFIPVVYLTALGDEETIFRANTTRCVGFLEKPVSQQQLEITLQETFDDLDVV